MIGEVPPNPGATPLAPPTPPAAGALHARDKGIDIEVPPTELGTDAPPVTPPTPNEKKDKSEDGPPFPPPPPPPHVPGLPPWKGAGAGPLAEFMADAQWECIWL